MSLSAASESRKQRLERLAALSKEDSNNKSEKRDRDDNDDHPKLNASAYITPRNFDPDSRAPISGVGDVIIQENETLEKLAQQIETQRRNEDQASDKNSNNNNNLNDISPNKQYQDLKKSLRPQLERLDAQTDNVIHSLVRQRIIEMKNQH